MAASNFIVKLHVTPHAARQQDAEDPVDNEADDAQRQQPHEQLVGLQEKREFMIRKPMPSRAPISSAVTMPMKEKPSATRTPVRI